MTRTHQRSTTRRGYGGTHQRLRAQWAPMVAAGRVKCWRCGELIKAGAPWHLGHDDDDRSKYRGPEHQACNLGAPRQRAAPPTPAVVTSPAPTDPPDDIDVCVSVGSWVWSPYDQRWITGEEVGRMVVPFDWKAWGCTVKPAWVQDRRPGVRDAR